MVELADTYDSGSYAYQLAGSSPVIRTSTSVLIGLEIGRAISSLGTLKTTSSLLVEIGSS